MTEKPIFVLTYDCPHRKTYDVLCMLKAKGYQNVTVFSCPMSYVKKFTPFYQHRPSVTYPINTNSLVGNLVYKNISINSVLDLKNHLDLVGKSPILIAGAGLIPEEFIDDFYFINAHPGFLPYARGLDAFKWSILENLPVGATSHRLGHEVDAGLLIERVRIQPQVSDTFHSLAYKVYEAEIKLLVEAVEKYSTAKEELVPVAGFPCHKRMPFELEKKIDITLKNYLVNENLYDCRKSTSIYY